MIKDLNFNEHESIIDPSEWLYDGDDYTILED